MTPKKAHQADSLRSDDQDDHAKLTVRTRTPRPDELSREAFEFITAVDEYKRRHMRSFLDDREVLGILGSLGYEGACDADQEQLVEFADARQRYRTEHGRLFPTWSEIFDLLLELGYRRADRDSAA